MSNEIGDKKNKARDMRINIEQITSAALSTKDEQEYWELVMTLHNAGTREVFETARKLCGSHNASERIFGVDILGQLGVPERTYPRESVDVLLEMLTVDESPEVLYSTAVALGNYGDDRALTPLARLCNHANALVRQGVAIGLAGQTSEQAIQLLITLSSDPDRDVRDWATFRLGSSPLLDNIDTPEIRNALTRRIDDDPEIRSAALRGLAIRDDKKVIAPLQEDLSREEVFDDAVEAALVIADPVLCSTLIDLRNRLSTSWQLLDDAIEACCRETKE